MVDFDLIEGKINKGEIEKCYVFCGIDEKIIKDDIELIANAVVDKSFWDLNYIKFDGSKASIPDIINACETMPFISEKKLIVVYRSSFLSEKDDKESKKKFDEISSYINDIPDHCVLVMYYVFENDREKPSNSVKKLEKKCTVVKIDKLKGEKFSRKVKTIFSEKGKDIGKVELKYFCDSVENNMDIVVREIDKLISYCEGRDIKKDDIIKLLPHKSDNDIFDLVDYLSQKRPEKAIDILNELLYRGENILGILFMIQRQFRLLLNVKIGLKEGATKEELVKKHRLHPFVAEKLIGQSRKFSLEQIKKCLSMCLNTEKHLKSSNTDKKIEMELLIVNTVKS